MAESTLRRQFSALSLLAFTSENIPRRLLAPNYYLTTKRFCELTVFPGLYEREGLGGGGRVFRFIRMYDLPSPAVFITTRRRRRESLLCAISPNWST